MRKIIQVAMSPTNSHAPDILALCNDGTLFNYTPAGVWDAMPPIPQPEIKSDEQAAFFARMHIRDELGGDNRPPMQVGLALRRVLDILEKGEL